ncbi:MAG: MATE family efflux transporter [Anaerolineae bacterium]|nr:MATE family efflux transporter [Anaerolineae bacterium]
MVDRTSVQAPARPAAAAPRRQITTVVPESASGVARAVNTLAWPITIENLFQTALGTANMMMAGRLGAEAVAGIGTSTQLLLVLQASIAALTTGTTVLVARVIGAGRPEEASDITKQSLSLGVLVSLLFAAIGLFLSDSLIRAMGAEAEVVTLGARYLRVVTGASVFLVTMLVCSAALRGSGDTRAPMKVTGMINFINVAVSYVLIFGRLGLPALGVAGAAWGATAARAVGTAVLLAILVRGDRGVSIRGRAGWGVNPGMVWRLLRLGLPSMGEQFFISGGNLLYGVVAMSLGTVVYATQRITFQAISLAFQPGMGFALGATAMVSQCLGAGRPDLSERAARHATTMAALWMSGAGGLMALFGRQVMGLFSSDAEIIAIGSSALIVLALSQPFQAVAQVTAGSLRGAGDTRFPMLSSFLGVWLFRLPFSYLFGPVLGWGLPGIYIANTLDGAARATATVLRYRTGRWRFIRV